MQKNFLPLSVRRPKPPDACFHEQTCARSPLQNFLKNSCRLLLFACRPPDFWVFFYASLPIYCEIFGYTFPSNEM
jgi:hypothetical protein